MQHVGLSVDNLCAKFHSVLVRNKKVLGTNRKNINGLLETGSAGTGSGQILIFITLIFCTNI